MPKLLADVAYERRRWERCGGTGVDFAVRLESERRGAAMRIAILADIHGNIWALEAVLADLKEQSADLVINLGDILSGPLEPAATADLLMALDLPTVAGNHERQLLACEHRPGSASDQFAFEQTTPRHRDWLSGLPSTLDVAGTVFACHGTPASDRTYFLEEVDSSGVRRRQAAAVEEHARGVERSLIVCGHSHLPRIESISGGRLVINPGSLGLQAYDDDDPCFHVIENGSPHARYAICERGRDGWSVWQRSIAYEHPKAAATARRNGRPEWAHWLENGRV